MQAEIFIQGLGLGLAYAAPIGIQNMFVINTALKEPRSRAILCAFAVALFDALLALACFYGAGSLIGAIPETRTAIMWIGGAMLLYIGCRIILSNPDKCAARDGYGSLLRAFWLAFALTWFNPQALLDGTLILGAMYANLDESCHFSFILGMCSASFFWFMGLSLALSLFRGFFPVRLLRYVNIICGALIILFGLKQIGSA